MDILVDGGWRVWCFVIFSMVESEVGWWMFVVWMFISDVWIFLSGWLFLFELGLGKVIKWYIFVCFDLEMEKYYEIDCLIRNIVL